MKIWMSSFAGSTYYFMDYVITHIHEEYCCAACLASKRACGTPRITGVNITCTHVCIRRALGLKLRRSARIAVCENTTTGIIPRPGTDRNPHW